nr:MAG TPA: protein of unknown function (DUF4349) [Caudoviricetes sp.]
MKCDEALNIIDMYLDECTDAYNEKEFLEHIQTCESCRNAYNEIKRITSELNNTEYLPLPDDFHSELTDKLIKSGKKRNKSRIVKYSALAACAVLVFMTGAYMKDLYYMASSGSSAQSADSASVTESSGMSRSASGEMPQASYEPYADGASLEGYGTAESEAQSSSENSYSSTALSAKEQNISRKIIKTGYISINVASFDEVSQLIKTYTEQNGGYVEQSNQFADYDSQTNTYKGKSGNITVRIESAKFSDAMGYIETLGTLINQSESVNDITNSYVDTQSRLEVKEQEKERLSELLNNADNISDIITIEGRLTEVISDIESYEAQLNAYDDVVDYSTINVNITEKDDDGIIPAKTDFANKAVYNFKDSARTLFSGFEGIVLLIIRLWAPIAVVAVIAVISVVFIKSKKNKK